MPVLRKRNHWHGLALECLRRTRTRFSALCYAVCYLVHHRHNKPLFRGLSVATRGELSNAFRLSQAYAYIIPHFSAQKLAKFQKKKRPLLAANCFPLFFFVFWLDDPLVGLHISDPVTRNRDDRLTIHVDLSSTF